MANLMSTVVNGNLCVTGDIYGTGQCFLIDVTDSSAFNKMVTAYKANKTIILKAQISISSATMTVIVPLVRVDMDSNNISKFTFAKAREYGDYPGTVDVWWSTSTSQGFSYDDPPADVYKVLYAAHATHSDTATSATSCTSNATTATTCTGLAAGTATRATNDDNGNNIINTYITKDDAKAMLGWMRVTDGAYNIYTIEGNLIANGTTISTSDAHFFDNVVQKAGMTRKICYYGSMTTSQLMVPGYYNWRTFTPYQLTVTNIGSSSLEMRVVAGGVWGSIICSGTIMVDGTPYSDDANIANWENGKRNQRSLGTVAAHTTRTWEIFWYADTKTFDPPINTVPNHHVYVSTVH